MTKEQILSIIKLLSAIEGWSLANNQKLPIPLLETLDVAMSTLTIELLK